MERAVARTAAVQALSDDTVRLYIPNISAITRRFVFDHRDYLAGYSNLVLDLRNNSGGLLSEFHRIAGLFLDDGYVIAHEYTRLSFFTRTIYSRGDAFFDFDHIIILQNRNTASAAEGLILALTANLPNVITIGETSFGKGIGQVTLPLTGSYAVRATVMRLYGPNREWIHEIGIEANIPGYGDRIQQAMFILGYDISGYESAYV